MKLTHVALGAVGLFLFALSTPAHAQVISSTRIEQGLTYPGASALGYVPLAERYNYKTGAFLYINGDARNLIYLDYLDRLDRAYKFGYPIPVDPFFPPTPPIASYPVETPPVVTGTVSAGGGGFFGFLRRR